MTRKNWAQMKWNCIEWDINAKKFVWFNVLTNDLLEDIEKAHKKKELTDRIVLEKIIDSWARYHYWSKAEHEIVLYDLFANLDCKGYKLDVYEQLKANWEIFIDFLVGGLRLDI